MFQIWEDPLSWNEWFDLIGQVGPGMPLLIWPDSAFESGVIQMIMGPPMHAMLGKSLLSPIRTLAAGLIWLLVWEQMIFHREDPNLVSIFLFYRLCKSSRSNRALELEFEAWPWSMHGVRAV